MRALLLGERRDLDESLMQGMARSGLIHLLAISGLHVGLFAMALVTILRAGALAAGVLGLGTAACLVGRAASTDPARRNDGACLFAGRLMGRRVAPTDALGLAIVVVGAAEPGALQQFGFHLSVVATTAIVSARHRTEALLVRMFGASLAASSAVAPLIAIQTGVLPIAGVLLNVVAIPAISASLVLMVGAMIAGVSALPAASVSLAVGAEAALDFVVGCSRAPAYIGVGPVTFASTSITLALVYGIGMVLAARARGRLRLAGALLTTLAIGIAIQPPSPPLHPRILALDVGQGDALLLVSADGAVLVDARGYPGIDYDTGYRIIEPELRRLGIDRLDVVAVSHDHADHAGGVPTILRPFRVAELWQGATLAQSETVVCLLELARQQHTVVLAPTALERSIAGCRWHSLPATDKELRAGAQKVNNEASLVLATTCGTKHILLTGDAGATAEKHWDLSSIVGTVLKVGHHGSSSATSNQLLSQLRPRHALVPMGAKPLVATAIQRAEAPEGASARPSTARIVTER